MKRIFYKIINPLKAIYWFLFRPKSMGVKCLIENSGKFLMIRNSYGHKKWTFPGGGIRSGELPRDAAKREALEEVGVEVTELVPIGNFFTTRQYKQETVECFYAQVSGEYFKIDDEEVSDASWFTLKDIPRDSSPAVSEVLRLHHSNS